jgi:hypothetical protein
MMLRKASGNMKGQHRVCMANFGNKILRLFLVQLFVYAQVPPLSRTLF